jgi:uncharacterized repeat protein (TIGR01451 family)
MGPRINSWRSRSSRRGLASVVSFLLLFAFALGQGSSLFALADGASTDPVTTEDVVSDGLSTDGALPAEEAPAEEAPAEEAPAVEEDSGDSEASATSTAPARRTAPKSSQLKTARADRGAGILSHGGLHGGDVSLDFVAAGPFTYDHETGIGGEFGDRTISKTDGVVESLEGGDFECGDLVVFFTQVVVDEGADGGGSIELDYSFGAETTGQPGVGFIDIVSVGINTGDSGMTDTGTAADADLVPGSEQTVDDELLGTVLVTGLDPGDEIIVRLVVELGCEIGDPTGNLLNAITDARVVGGDTIRVGEQTVPMKQVGDVARPGMNVDKTCPPVAQEGDLITYNISITNTGNEDLDLTSVIDTVNGHAPDDITDLFPATIEAGTTVDADYTYTVQPGDPDPLPNSVAVSAEGQISEATITGNASCETDLDLNPSIDVEKTCPDFGQVGDTVTYTITVTNDGDETLEDVTVDDSLLGDLSASFDDVFSPGETESHDFPYTIQEGDPNPLPNVVTATGTGATSQVTVDDVASCDTALLNPDIDVAKTCPPLAHVGDEITYTITVTNSGDEDLEGITVTDTVLGDLSGSFADTLDAGDSESHDFPYTIQAGDDDPLTNEVTAAGSGVLSQEAVDETAACVTDIIHPGIDIVKTVSDEVVPVGTTVTFTYVVTNTGDTTLYEISVDDDIMGHIGDIPVLEPGASVTLTKDFVVGDEIVTNVGTAVGEDILGRTVSADDDATVGPIFGGGNPPNPPNPPTPFTGSDAGQLAFITLVLLGIGVTVVAATRRRRPEDEAA